MDAIDRRILQELSADGRLTNLALAGRVGLSPSACLRRVQELERKGIITGYRAVVDPKAAGRALVVYVAISLSEHTKAAQAAFERRIEPAEEVRECHNVTGAFEYLLRVEAEDLAAYKRFHTEVLGTIPAVRQITSYIVMGSAKDARA
ncbi:Lrp/AsnC family transcriptional regulator [Pseudoroseicyclus sp. CXY001]|uniref:Lrp/AsnC family transcriptional regulator n=1 Tax=Pseudoroseicyclus sp. CXY001 TaxID=3242492 RepID=UPI00358DC312